MTLPSRSEVEQTLASFEGCLPEILNAKYALAGRQLVEWVRELSAEVERIGEELRHTQTQLDEQAGLAIEIVHERDRLSAKLSAQSGEVERLRRALDVFAEWGN